MALKSIFDLWNKIWITLWLALVYLLCLWLVLGALSSYQLQSRISSDNEQNQTGNTVSAVIRQLREIENLDYQIEIAQQEIKNTKFALQEILIHARSLERELDQMLPKLERLKNRLGQSLGIDSDDADSPLDYYCKRLQEMLSSADLTEADYAEISKSVNDTCGRAAIAQRELPYKKREIPIKKIALQSMEFELQELQSEHKFLLRKNTLIRDYLTELKHMKKFQFDFLATMPGQLLTLMLTLSMGALGSIIYLTRAFFDPTVKHGFTWYLFRPFLGMIMALAIFVLIKSGQLTISEGDSGDTLSGLSPFFLSFVAIISGLLSEQAYQKIYLAGQNFFGGVDSSSERWALNLGNAIDSRGRQASELLRYLSASQAELDEWISAARPVPQQQQNIIAAWLDMPTREIFSDQPPGESLPAAHEHNDEIANPRTTVEK